ncbi:helix-turn-helix domain-containing protein [Ruminococcaceae bacterium OttesenSCG-928-A11]|nr:helix-turn-helix domain-containing protein [Ruminococcaceae bacterium OttesenSCG-928-A11]
MEGQKARQPSEFGSLILSKLTEKNMTQSQLARQIGVSKQSLYQVIWGVIKPTKQIFFGALNVLELDQLDALRAFFGQEAWEKYMIPAAQETADWLKRLEEKRLSQPEKWRK